jgi:AcrR family transcriptional regulator
MASIKDKTRAVRRQHVLDAATAVFAQKGFRGATIRDVSIAAGVSDGTIYNVFENKAALLRAILAGAEAQPTDIQPGGAVPLPDLLRARWSAIAPQRLAMLRVVLSEALIDPDFRSLYYETLLAPAINQLAAPLSAHALNSGADDTSQYDARLLTAVFSGLVMMRLLNDDVCEQDDEKLLDRLAIFISQGLAPPLKCGDMA